MPVFWSISLVGRIMGSPGNIEGGGPLGPNGLKGLESEKGHPGPKDLLPNESGLDREGRGRAIPAVMEQSCGKSFVIILMRALNGKRRK